MPVTTDFADFIVEFAHAITSNRFYAQLIPSNYHGIVVTTEEENEFNTVMAEH
jgi:hypothetical protein